MLKAFFWPVMVGNAMRCKAIEVVAVFAAVVGCSVKVKDCHGSENCDS